MCCSSRIRLVALVVTVVAACGCSEVKARHRIQQGNKHYKDNQYADAVRTYEEALELAPQLATGWYNLALAHLALFTAGNKAQDNLAHADRAVEALTRYLELEPKDNNTCAEPPCARNFLLSTYIDSGRYPKVIEFFEGELGKNPKDTLAIANIAKTYRDAGEFDRAVTWYKKLAEAERTYDEKANAFCQIGVMSFLRLLNHAEVMGEERARIADQGLKGLARALELRQNHADTYSYMNLLYRQRALAHGPSYVRVGEVATAQIHYKKALDLKGSAPLQKK